MKRIMLLALPAMLMTTAVAQAGPSEWTSAGLPIAIGETVEATGTGSDVTVAVSLAGRKRKLREKCAIRYSLALRDEGEHGQGTVTGASLTGCALASKGGPCKVAQTAVNILTPFPTILQATGTGQTGFRDEWAMSVEMPCFGLFTGTLTPDVGDNDYVKLQDDIDHSIKFRATSGELEDAAGDTLTIVGPTSLGARVTAERLGGMTRLGMLPANTDDGGEVDAGGGILP